MVMGLYGKKMNTGGWKTALACSCKVRAAESSPTVYFSLCSVIMPVATACSEGLRYESFLATCNGIGAVGNLDLSENVCEDLL